MVKIKDVLKTIDDWDAPEGEKDFDELKRRLKKLDDSNLGHQEASKQWIHREKKWDIKRKIFAHKLKYAKF